jgi:hypothetical protein
MLYGDMFGIIIGIYLSIGLVLLFGNGLGKRVERLFGEWIDEMV